MNSIEEIQIREATLDNLDEILSLSRLLFIHHSFFDTTLNQGWTDSVDGIEYFRRRINSGVAFIALNTNQEVVGYLTGAILPKLKSRTLDSLAELQNMYVIDSYRNRGVGSALVLRFLDWCNKGGTENIKVVVWSRNTNAIEFYRHLGFEDYLSVLEYRQ